MKTISVEPQKSSADAETYPVPPLVQCAGKKRQCFTFSKKGYPFIFLSAICFDDFRAKMMLMSLFSLPVEAQPHSYNFRFTSRAVLQHITASADGRTVVLLIDELNSLRSPADRFGADLLRTEFLEKTGRYLVFSTHVPMNLDVSVDDLTGTGSSPATFRGFDAFFQRCRSYAGDVRRAFRADLSHPCTGGPVWPDTYPRCASAASLPGMRLLLRSFVWSTK